VESQPPFLKRLLLQSKELSFYFKFNMQTKIFPLTRDTMELEIVSQESLNNKDLWLSGEETQLTSFVISQHKH